MAESTLSLAYGDLRAIIGHCLGYGRTVANWSTEQSDDVDEIIHAGVRQFYNPPPLPNETMGHEWSFLRPTTTLSTVADDGDYDLPDDFGGIYGVFTYAQDDAWHSIKIVPEHMIRQKRMYNVGSDRPVIACIRPKAYDATDGQRFEALFWPTPDAVYVLSYQYNSMPGKLTTAAPYPLGGMRHAETLSASCLAIAEQRKNDTTGHHHNNFMQRLAASISIDRSAMAPRFLGYNGDASGGEADPGRDSNRAGIHSVSYNSTIYGG